MIITFTRTWHNYYIVTRHLVLLNSCTPELLNSCTSELLYPLYLCPPALLLLLIAQSDRRSAEHAWCRDDEYVSYNRASVRRILNGTKCHTEQSVIPHTWWGPPLESVGATSRIHSPQSKVSHGVKCHITRDGGHLLNLWGPPLESVGLSPDCATWC